MKLRLMIYLLLGFFSLIILLSLGFGYYFSAPGYSGPESEHFDGNKFINQNGTRAKNFLEIIKWAIDRNQGEWRDERPNWNYASKPAASITDSIKITYINHATFLIQLNGLNILTDPIFSYRASPFSFTGPERMRLPGIRFQDLPEIDAVLISHNHYDHLDLPTLKKLNEKFEPLVIAPLGVEKFLNKMGISKTVELDWWQEHSLSNIEVISVPAQHFSSRGLFDKDKTLWSGYVIKSNSGGIYFAGDTGYGEFFKEIGERFEIEVGLIPIGAYEPRWVMKDIHLNPAEAVLAQKDVGAKLSIGMHFGTFPLADDGQLEPVQDLQKALEAPENAGIDFKTLKEGESVTIKNSENK